MDLYDAGFYEGSSTSGTGDTGWGLTGPTTTYTLYEPDGTLFDHTDNPTATCTLGAAGTNGIWVVPPESSSPDTEEHWNGFCGISPGATIPGQYILQVQVNGNYGHALNQFAIRATADSGADPAAYGIDAMSIYANFTGISATFYLAKVDDVHAGKDLEITLFDAGDTNSGSPEIFVLDPTGSVASSCSWTVESWETGPGEDSGSTCYIDATRPAQDYNGDWIRVTVQLPGDYTCDPAIPDGCWWKIRLDYDDPFDRTTWEARIRGNPIHLANG